jgi:hypothetical protein
MPFSFINKSAGDLIKSQDWNSAMAAIAALYDRLSGTTGHRHTGSAEDGPQISTGGIGDLAITNPKLGPAAVDGTKIASNSVGTAHVVNSAIDGTKLANNSVGTAHVVNGAIDVTKLAANSVANGQIQNNAVTVGKIAANSVGSTQLIDLSVSVNKIVDNSIITQKIADGQVTAAKLAAGVAPEVATSQMNYITDGQAVSLPSGFAYYECRFFVSIPYFSKTFNAFPVQIYHDAWVSLIWNGSTYIPTLYTASGASASVYANVLVLARRGGW